MKKIWPLELALFFFFAAWCSGTPVGQPVTLPKLQDKGLSNEAAEAKRLYLLAYGYSLEAPEHAKGILKRYYFLEGNVQDQELKRRAALLWHLLNEPKNLAAMPASAAATHE